MCETDETNEAEQMNRETDSGNVTLSGFEATKEETKK